MPTLAEQARSTEGVWRCVHEHAKAAAAGLAAFCRCRKWVLVAFALHPLAQELAVTPHGLGLLASAALGRLLVITAELHLAEHAFALHFLLQRTQRLVHIVVANEHLHEIASPFPKVNNNRPRKRSPCCQVNSTASRDCEANRPKEPVPASGICATLHAVGAKMSQRTIERSVAVAAMLLALLLASCAGSGGGDQPRSSGSLYSHDEDGPYSR